jgi:hypothetical protein
MCIAEVVLDVVLFGVNRVDSCTHITGGYWEKRLLEERVLVLSMKVVLNVDCGYVRYLSAASIKRSWYAAQKAGTLVLSYRKRIYYHYLFML